MCSTHEVIIARFGCVLTPHTVCSPRSFALPPHRCARRVGYSGHPSPWCTASRSMSPLGRENTSCRSYRSPLLVGRRRGRRPIAPLPPHRLFTASRATRLRRRRLAVRSIWRVVTALVAAVSAASAAMAPRSFNNDRQRQRRRLAVPTVPVAAASGSS